MAEIAICSNPWCKVQITYDGDKPKVCKKCESFDNDLSGGTTWVDKKYDGPRFDGMPHVIDIRINKYSDKR